MPAPDWSVQKFARRLLRLERDFKTLSTVPRLGNSSIDSGALLINGPTGDPVVVIGEQDDGTHGVVHVSGPTPPQPSTPLLTSGLGVIHIEWDGTFVGKNLLSPVDDIVDNLVTTDGATVMVDLVNLRGDHKSLRVTTDGTDLLPGFAWLVEAADLDPNTPYAFSAYLSSPGAAGDFHLSVRTGNPVTGPVVASLETSTLADEWKRAEIQYVTPQTPTDVYFIVTGNPEGLADSFYNVADLQAERGDVATAYEKRPSLSELPVPLDWSRIEVHVSDEAGFTPDPLTTLRTTIESPRGGRTGVAVPYEQDFHVRFIARTLSGKGSTPSVEAVERASKIDTPDIKPFAVKAGSIEDFALAVTKFKTLNHQIY